jgi:hypothetical protein
MCSNAVSNIVLLILVFLGIGHYNGVATALGFKQKKPGSYESKYLIKVLNIKLNRIICFIVYFLPMAGFVLAAFSFKGWIIDSSWWQTLAFYSTIPSLIAYGLFWNATTDLFNKIFTIVMNVYIILSIFWIHWPEVIF